MECHWTERLLVHWFRQLPRIPGWWTLHGQPLQEHTAGAEHSRHCWATQCMVLGLLRRSDTFGLSVSLLEFGEPIELIVPASTNIFHDSPPTCNNCLWSPTARPLLAVAITSSTLPDQSYLANPQQTPNTHSSSSCTKAQSSSLQISSWLPRATTLQRAACIKSKLPMSSFPGVSSQSHV